MKIKEVILDPKSAVNLMKENKVDRLCFNNRKVKVKWEWIPMSKTRDYDGTLAGWPDDRSNEEVLELLVWKTGEEPRYTNFWSFKRSSFN